MEYLLGLIIVSLIGWVFYLTFFKNKEDQKASGFDQEEFDKAKILKRHLDSVNEQQAQQIEYDEALEKEAEEIRQSEWFKKEYGIVVYIKGRDPLEIPGVLKSYVSVGIRSVFVERAENEAKKLSYGLEKGVWDQNKWYPPHMIEKMEVVEITEKKPSNFNTP